MEMPFKKQGKRLTVSSSSSDEDDEASSQSAARSLLDGAFGACFGFTRFKKRWPDLDMMLTHCSVCPSEKHKRCDGGLCTCVISATSTGNTSASFATIPTFAESSVLPSLAKQGWMHLYGANLEYGLRALLSTI